MKYIIKEFSNSKLFKHSKIYNPKLMEFLKIQNEKFLYNLNNKYKKTFFFIPLKFFPFCKRFLYYDLLFYRLISFKSV